MPLDDPKGETRWLFHVLILAMAGIIGVLIGYFEEGRTARLRSVEQRLSHLERGEIVMCSQHRDLERLLRTPGAKPDIDCSFLFRREEMQGP